MKTLFQNKKGAIIIEGHIQGLSNTRSLGEVGIPVYVVDKNNCIAQYSKYCKKFFKCPDYKSEDFINFLIEIAKSEKLEGWALIPSNDHAVYNISKNKHILQKFYSVITPDIDIINNIYDKRNLLKIAKDLNIPIPKTIFLSSADEVNSNSELDFPLITKGRFGLSFYKTMGKKVFLSKNINEFKEHLKIIESKYNISETFTQELIPYYGNNKTVSFTAFCIEGDVKTYWIGEKIREHPIQFGTATSARSIIEKELLEQSKILLKNLNYTGVCEIEYIYDPRIEKHLLIEINARTWLWVELAKKCGINYALYIYNYLNGLSIDFPKHYSEDVYWVNLFTDIPYSLIALIRNQLNIKEFIQSYKGRVIFATFNSKDLMPSFMFFILLPYIFIKRT
ncbi:carboxylate--amine ligase [Tenuifilum thalassicum]|uniref:ATP-grasp domain-containing protein n=1 Tax=Tenuifilum thalassicum TaxID=2590900 RepID=A0A7D4BY17_9BACT|nr:hypothetical protein [Tenuifilum thalassicum]QKG78804.1 hypothetical protein FHG85_00475 [Tenuifilum thalassicum]